MDLTSQLAISLVASGPGDSRLRLDVEYGPLLRPSQPARGHMGRPGRPSALPGCWASRAEPGSPPVTGNSKSLLSKPQKIGVSQQRRGASGRWGDTVQTAL